MPRELKVKVNDGKQIRLGAIMSYFAIGFNILSGLIYTPWMVSQIGQSDYGLYTLAISLISFFAIDFGLGSAVSRFLSRYLVTNDLVGAKRFLGITYKLYLYITIFILFLLIVVYFQIENIYTELTITEVSKLKVIFCISGFFSIISFPLMPLNGILISNERFIFSKFVDLMQKVLNVILMIAALVVGYKLYAVVIVNAFVGIIAIVIKLVYIKKYTKTEVDFSYKDKSLLKEIFSFSSWTTIISLSQRLILNITPTILGAFAGSIQISLFSIGMTIEGYTWTISNALGGLFLPKVTRMTLNNNSIDEIENLMIKVGRLQLLIAGLIIVVFGSMGQEFLKLWMGENFADSYVVALLLIVPCIISLTQQIANTALIAINEIRYRAIASLTVAGTSLILSIILSRSFGAIGSALAIFIGNIIGIVIIMNVVYYKVLRINIFRFFRECHLKMGLPLILTFFIGLVAQHIFPVNNLLLFMIKVVIVGLIYFVFMWLISFNNYEKNLFLGGLIKVHNISKNRR